MHARWSYRFNHGTHYFQCIYFYLFNKMATSLQSSAFPVDSTSFSPKPLQQRLRNVWNCEKSLTCDFDGMFRPDTDITETVDWAFQINYLPTYLRSKTITYLPTCVRNQLPTYLPTYPLPTHLPTYLPTCLLRMQKLRTPAVGYCGCRN